MEREWMPLTEAAGLLNLSWHALRHRIKTGSLSGMRGPSVVSGEQWSQRWLVSAAQVHAEVEERLRNGPSRLPRTHQQLDANPIPEEDRMTVSQACAVLGVHKRTIYERIRLGIMVGARDVGIDPVGRELTLWFVSRSEVLAEIETRKRPEITVAEAAYLAGLIDGEGCIRIGQVKSMTGRIPFHHALMLTIAMTDLPVLTWCHQVFKGNLGNHPTARSRQSSIHKLQYSWKLNGKDCAWALEQTLPYMKVKHQHAEIAIKFSKTIYPKGWYQSRSTITVEQFKEREQMRQEISLLNKRGR